MAATVPKHRSNLFRARFLIPVVVFVVVAVFLGVGLKLDPRLVPSPLIDKPAPSFSLPELRDPAHTITEKDLMGGVSLVNVWASWCVACRQEHPLVMELAQSGEVRIVGLNYKDERADAINWLNRLGNPYVATAADRDGPVGIEWGVYGVPETLVVDRNGIIRHKHIGPVDAATLPNEIVPIVRELKAEGG